MSEATSTGKAEGMLKVLCILTLIGAGLGVVGSLLNFGVSILWTMVIIIGCGLKIFGALQMMKLKKTGFFMWIVGDLMHVIGYWMIQKAAVAMVMAFSSSFGGSEGAMANAMMSSAASSMVTISLIVGLVLFAIWAALYGSQMKNMS